MSKRGINELSARCDVAIGSFRLLDHPFYQAWNKGTLPVEALEDYAREYGSFIKTISKGWETLGKDRIARHEMAHARVWDNTFAAALGTSVDEPKVEEVVDLLNITNELF